MMAARMSRSTCHGMTLVELSVVTALGLIVFGMILQAMIDTERAGREVTLHQTLRQEAVTISRAVERELRFRVSSDDLEPAAFSAGGAGQDASAAGGTAVDAPTTQPAPVAVRKPSADRFASDSITFNSLAPGTGQSERTITITNRATGDGFKDIVRIASETGLSPASDAPGTVLGNNRDQVQAEVAFRYASSFKGTDAEWQPSSETTPRLVEYTIRVWPRDKKYPDYESAKTDRGSAAAFEYASGVALP